MVITHLVDKSVAVLLHDKTSFEKYQFHFIQSKSYGYFFAGLHLVQIFCFMHLNTILL